MKKQLIKPGLYIMCSIMLLFSCKKEEQSISPLTESLSIEGRAASDNSNVFKGPNVAIGNGHARSWIRINHLDMPLEIGIELTASAFSSLPDHINLVLPLHHKAQETTPFEHIYFGYNEEGHPPAGVFSVPHFDAHFYMTTNQERLAIPEVTPATLPFFTLAPPADYMPLSYFQAGPEPQMGQHWIPPPPSFLPFSRVMVYGTYNGEFTFLEPMVTVAYMTSVGNTNTPSINNYPQPAKFAEAGNYPTTYNIYKDPKNGNYNITLSNFVARSAN
ncbi:MAG: hypothetical protein ABIP79_04660 [Chitinophagaceae bacterium]